jgi:hypothetical protein
MIRKMRKFKIKWMSHQSRISSQKQWNWDCTQSKIWIVRCSASISNSSKGRNFPGMSSLNQVWLPQARKCVQRKSICLIWLCARAVALRAEDTGILKHKGNDDNELCLAFDDTTMLLMLRGCCLFKESRPNWKWLKNNPLGIVCIEELQVKLFLKTLKINAKSE